MLLRVVRMEFKQERLKDFHAVFEQAKPKILAMKGCNHVEICEDPSNFDVRYTFSKWDSVKDLEAYRESKLFKSTWTKTKTLFSGKPSAYSLISTED